MDAAGQLAQFGDGGLGRGVRLVDERLRGGRIGVDLLLGQAQRHADRDEARLDAVVQVALDAGAFDLAGAHGALPLRAGLARLLDELGFTVRHEDRPRQHAVEHGDAGEQGGADDEAEGADQQCSLDGDVEARDRHAHGVAAEERGEQQHEARGEPADQRQHEQAEDGRDRGRRDAAPHRAVGELVQTLRSHPANPGRSRRRARRAGRPYR